MINKEFKPKCFGNLKQDSKCRCCDFYQDCLEITMDSSIAISERDY
jgi:hypothetical protein